MRVLMWILDRCEGKADAVETAIGYEPKPEDINLEGLNIDLDTLKDLLTVDPQLWKEDADGIEAFYAKFGDKLPAKLREELNSLKDRLSK